MSAIILTFTPRPANRMTRQDRYDALDWVYGDGKRGYTRLLFETSGDDHDLEMGDYLLFYGAGQMWYSWGICRRGGKYVLWRASDGRNFAATATIREALAAIPPFPARRLRA